MANSELFGAVSKNCKTVIVDRSKKAVREEIAQRGVAKNNIAMFKCLLSDQQRIRKKILHKPRFKLRGCHHEVLESACLDFWENGMGT